jgi:hypothetical protein
MADGTATADRERPDGEDYTMTDVMSDVPQLLWPGRSAGFDLGGSGANRHVEHECAAAAWPLAALLERALRELIARRPLLRTVVRPDGRTQVLAGVPPYRVRVEDLAGRSPAAVREGVERVRDELRHARRPLDRWPLFDVVLQQVDPNSVRVHWRFEATLVDETVCAELLHELARLVGGQSLAGSAGPVGADLAPVDERSVAYWRERLATLPGPPLLPLTAPLGPDTVPRTVERRRELLTTAAWHSLRGRAAEAGVPPAEAVVAAVAETLRLWSAGPSFSLGFARSSSSLAPAHVLAVEDRPGPFADRARWLADRLAADEQHRGVTGPWVWREHARKHGLGARALLPVHVGCEIGQASAPAPDPDGEPLLLRQLRPAGQSVTIPHRLLTWAVDDSAGALRLVSRSVDGVLPDGLPDDLVTAFGDLLGSLATDPAAWRSERPARRRGSWPPAEPAWPDGAPGVLGYGARPGFVETALERHPDVREARVTWADGSLTASVAGTDGTDGVAGPAGPVTDDDLRGHLRARLPEHLIPDTFEWRPRTAGPPGTPEPPVDRTSRATPDGTPAGPARLARVSYFHPPARPFSASCAIVNAHLNEALSGLGYAIDGTYGDGGRPSDADVYVPLPAVERAARARTAPAADVSVHCDVGLQVSPLVRTGGQRNVVFFHGFAGSPDQWAGNPLIDRYWGNSRYTRDVVRSLLARPDWHTRRLLDPRAFGVVSYLTLALPCLEEPDALQEGSSELPQPVRAALDRGDILGHAVEAAKVDERALVGILLVLNRMAQERGPARRFRVCVSARVFRRVQGVLNLPPAHCPPDLVQLREGLDELGLTVADLLLPVPRLAQPALFELIRECRFGVFHNVMPESFGFYALESVLNGCPVYTNGAGNLRHLLPPDHGIEVQETAAMTGGDPEAYVPVAEAVYRDTVTDPGGAARRCAAGAEYVRRNHNRDCFRRDVAAELDRLGSTPGTAALEDLTVGLSPLVRLWSPETSLVVTDHSPRQLGEAELEAATAALGRTGRDVLARAGTAELDALQALFRNGVLALEPPEVG